MFLSSQQGRLRVDDGHGAIAPSLTSEAQHSALPVDSPDRFQLGPAWILAVTLLPAVLVGFGGHTNWRCKLLVSGGVTRGRVARGAKGRRHQKT